MRFLTIVCPDEAGSGTSGMLNPRSEIVAAACTAAPAPALRRHLAKWRSAGRVSAPQLRARPAQAPVGFLATSVPGAAPVQMQPAGKAGQWAGQWQLEALIGRGGMGEVWRAQCIDGFYGKVAAVKLIKPGCRVRACRFASERARLGLMDHPGIARLLGSGTIAGGAAYMTMDLIDGGLIDAHAAVRPVCYKIRLMAELCDAVHHAHSKRVLHLDIKPSNVMIDQAGQVKLIDFGSASAISACGGGGPLTLAYAAPEQLRGWPLSPATDIFALGALLSQLLTGYTPQRKEDASLVKPASRLPRELRSIIARASGPIPSERYSSAAVMAAELRALNA